MPTTPPSITALPAPPDPNDRATFNARAYPWSVAQQTLATELEAVAANVKNNADETLALATAASGFAGAAMGYAEDAEQAKDGAEAAVLSIDTLNAQYLGAQASNPTTGKDGVPLVAGNFYINTGTGALLAYDGSSWVQAVASSGGVSTINGLAGSVELPRRIAYADRATLRANETWAHALVDGLGWFQWFTGSTEPDDDESCFATASGRWLLQAPHWDVVSLWSLPNDSTRDRQIEDQLTAWPGRVLRGTAVCGITSLTTVSSTAFTGTIVGAAIGDRVVATPPAVLGATDGDSARLSYHAYVSATDTIAIRLCNASAATATTNTAIQAAWPVIVIKEV